jgi:hypothetical protein
LQRYTHPGRTPFVDDIADDLGLIDTELNGQPVAKAGPRLAAVENFVSQATQAEFAEQPDKQLALLANTEDAVDSLRLSYLAGLAMVRAAYEGLGLGLPDWLADLVGSNQAHEDVPAETQAEKPKGKRGRPKRDPAPQTETEPHDGDAEETQG